VMWFKLNTSGSTSLPVPFVEFLSYEKASPPASK